MPRDLLDSSSESGSDVEDNELAITINEHYAKAYEYRKEREELAKLKEKYGSDYEEGGSEDEESDSESDESEDEDGEELTPAVDAAILRTLARIRNKDPEIYEMGKNVFDEEHGKSGSLPAPAARKKEKASKPIRLSTKQLVDVLDPAVSDSDADSDALAEPTHVEEQQALRAETIAAFHSGVGVGKEEEEDDLLQLREKTDDEVAREEAEYRAYLEKEVQGLEGLIEVEESNVREKDEDDVKEEEPDAKDGEGKKKRKKKKKGKREEDKPAQTDQEFLMKYVHLYILFITRSYRYNYHHSYILNRGWIDRNSKRLPTFEEIAPARPTLKARKEKEEGEEDVTPATGANAIEEDEDEFDDVVDRFEASYNFRFEEPEAADIHSFPRTIESVRRPSEHAEKRKEARERRKERKEAEKAQKKEEVQRLKNLKLKEMNVKLERIGKEGGWASAQALQALDVDGDWDPEEYDRQMAAVLQEVEGEDDAELVDDEKPTWDDDIDIGDIALDDDVNADENGAGPSTALNNRERRKNKKKEKKEKKRKRDAGEDGEEDGVDVDMMDAEAEVPEMGGDGDGGEEWDGTEEMRKRVLDKYMEDVYGMEFNDVVGGLPTRFKYATVAPTTYGLSPVDILMADDRDLNEFMGLKKYAPYRREKTQWDPNRPHKLKKLHEKLGAKGVYEKVGTGEGRAKDGEGEGREKKRMGKKERLKARAAAEADAGEGEGEMPGKRAREEEDGAVAAETGEAEPAKKKRRRHKKAGQAEA
ncbi:Krr1-domain-containing protein [Peniophora sp. CONT]|nr:Krr1-domain-containing protein [Peniophora sp. CONT]